MNSYFWRLYFCKKYQNKNILIAKKWMLQKPSLNATVDHQRYLEQLAEE